MQPMGAGRGGGRVRVRCVGPERSQKSCRPRSCESDSATPTPRCNSHLLVGQPPQAAPVSKQRLKLDLNPTTPKPQAKPQEPDLCQVRDACQTYLMSWLAKKREDKGQAVDRVASARGVPCEASCGLEEMQPKNQHRS